MKPSILVVMLDFLVCSLLLFVIGTGGKQTRFATSAPPASGSTVAEEYSPAAMQAQQEEWNRDYDQQFLLTRLNTESTENEQLRGENRTLQTVTAQREQSIRILDASVKNLAAEKTKVEQAKSQTEQALSTIETQLARVSSERQKLQQEGEAAKTNLAKLQTEFSSLQTQQSKLQQEKNELHQRAQQLDQTVASQQSTISTLGEQVRAAQARMEAQLTDVARDQQQMVSTLKQLDDFARTLPATVQKNVASVHDDQQALQDNIAALAEGIKGLQGGLNADEKTRLMQAVADVAKGQQDLESWLTGLTKGGTGDQIAQSLGTIQAGQDALRQQTARLSEQIEGIKAHGPGPYQAVKGGRLELLVAIAKRDSPETTPMRFRAAAYPPVVRVEGRSLLVANSQSLGLNWWALAADYTPPGEITELKYTIGRRGESPWSSALIEPACALRADPRVVTIELVRLLPGLNTMELAGPEASLQVDQHKLHVFKSTAAGLSFEVDASPDLADARYLVVKRPFRGIAAWFENPAYRADVGDYVVTADGKLVGIMVTRDKCFLLSKDNILACALTIPLGDKQQFLTAARQLPRVK